MSVRASIGVAVVVLTLVPALARAQESASGEIEITDAGSDGVPLAVFTSVSLAGQMFQPARPGTQSSGVLMSLYVSTVAMQLLDVHSTYAALGSGGVEANSVVAPMTSHPALLIAAKAAVAMTTIYAAHRLSQHNKAAAIGMLVAINSAYAFVVSHNYRVGGQ